MPLKTLEYPLSVRNPRPVAESRIALVSLPVPLGVKPPTSLGGLPTQTQPVGWWPEQVAGRRGRVRRQLMIALSDSAISDSLDVGYGRRGPRTYKGPEVSGRIVYKKNVGIDLCEVNEAEIAYGDKTLGLRLGLIHKGEYHWWEWVRIEELWSGPLCKAIRIGGYIEVEHFGEEHYRSIQSLAQSKAVHFHNWLFGEVYALLFANGAVQLACRHINNHVFDHGRDLEDVTPVIGFACRRPPSSDVPLDGSRLEFDLDGVRLDLRDAASMVSPERPGRLKTDGGMVIYQPYEGVEIRGDTSHRIRSDGYVCRASEKLFPKGVARTVRFGLAMGRTAPAVTRLTVPDWHYGMCRELWGDDVLPSRDAWDRVVESCEDYVREQAARQYRSFDNGILTPEVWEGEIPYSQMLYYYLRGDPQFFDVALCDSYHHADIGFDHATETIRMHNYPFGAIAPPLYRTVGLTYAYLETADPYLLECAESAAMRFYSIDRHNWPRRSYGRDGASIRSLIFLWDYTGKSDYIRMAREALGKLIACQRPDGSYADQGGTVGGCGGCAHEITKVWMAMLANDPVVDYLIRCPGDRDLERAAVKTAEFVLKSQLVKNGKYYWAYEYAYGDNPGNAFEMLKDPVNYARHPTHCAVSGYKARFLSFLTALTGENRYFEAWERFHATNWGIAGQEPHQVGYTMNKVIQCVPYAQAHRWDARVKDGVVWLTPMVTTCQPAVEGSVSTPFGTLAVKCERHGQVMTIETHSSGCFDVRVAVPGGTDPERMSSNEKRTITLRA